MSSWDEAGWRRWPSSEQFRPEALVMPSLINPIRRDRTDPLDQTHISYYDSNEVIPCDIVVLKDANGQVITVT